MRRTYRRPLHRIDRPARPEAPPSGNPTGASGPDTRRRPIESTGLGPYESSYDISTGYGSDRSILLR